MCVCVCVCILFRADSSGDFLFRFRPKIFLEVVQFPRLSSFCGHILSHSCDRVAVAGKGARVCAAAGIRIAADRGNAGDAAVLEEHA